MANYRSYCRLCGDDCAHYAYYYKDGAYMNICKSCNEKISELKKSKDVFEERCSIAQLYTLITLREYRLKHHRDTRISDENVENILLVISYYINEKRRQSTLTDEEFSTHCPICGKYCGDDTMYLHGDNRIHLCKECYTYINIFSIHYDCCICKKFSHTIKKNRDKTLNEYLEELNLMEDDNTDSRFFVCGYCTYGFNHQSYDDRYFFSITDRYLKSRNYHPYVRGQKIGDEYSIYNYSLGGDNLRGDKCHVEHFEKYFENRKDRIDPEVQKMVYKKIDKAKKFLDEKEKEAQEIKAKYEKTDQEYYDNLKIGDKNYTLYHSYKNIKPLFYCIVASVLVLFTYHPIGYLSVIWMIYFFISSSNNAALHADKHCQKERDRIRFWDAKKRYDEEQKEKNKNE